MGDLSYLGRFPQREAGVFVAPDATLIGGVSLAADSSVFFQCVLRADIHDIRIGARSNIQDHTTVHVSSTLPTVVGEDVSVGHRCILHACTLGNRILVGMGAIVMDGCSVGDDCIIGAGSLLPKGKAYPAGSLILGSPARAIRPLTEEEKASVPALARKYLGVKDRYLGA